MIKISFYLTVKFPPYRYIFAYICMCVYKHANIGIRKIVTQKFLELVFSSPFSLNKHFLSLNLVNRFLILTQGDVPDFADSP